MKPLKSIKTGTKSWLVMTIFIRVEHWNRFYMEAIKPIIRRNVVLQWMPKLNLENNHQFIELEFRICTQYERTEARKMHQLINDFLSSVKNETETVSQLFGSDEPIFTPFPPNSIQYGLFKIKKKIPLNKELYKTLDRVARCALSCLTNYDDYIILSFQLFCFLTISYGNGTLFFLDKVLLVMAREDSVIDKMEFYVLFNAEEELFRSLYDQVNSLPRPLDHFFFNDTLNVRTYKNQTIIPIELTEASNIDACIESINMIQMFIKLSEYIKWSLLIALRGVLNK